MAEKQRRRDAVMVRIDDELVERLDKLAGKLSDELMVKVSRTNVVNRLLVRALEHAERGEST